MHPLEPQLVATIVCPRCGADLSPRLAMCTHCQAVLNATPTGADRDGSRSASIADAGEPILAVEVAARAKPAEPKRDAWLDSKLFILGMLFGAAMFLGLPWLWKSRAFSRGGKVIVTILVLLETVLVFWAFFAVMAWSYRSIKDSL